MAAVLNGFDYVILVIFFLAISLGLIRGLVSEVVSIITLVAAFIVATTFASQVSMHIMGYDFIQHLIVSTSSALGGNTETGVSYVTLGISFLLLFIATLILGAIVKTVLNIAVHTGLLGIGNRLAGGVFGLGKGFILSLVLIFLIKLTPMTTETWWQQSYFVNLYQPALAWLEQRIAPTIEEIKEKLKNTNISDSLQSLTGVR